MSQKAASLTRIALAAYFALGFSPRAHADTANWFATNAHPQYLVWMTGMHTEALNGDRDGTGQNLEFDHYLHLSADLGNYNLKLTLWTAQIIDEDPTTRQFQPGDPYFTLENLKLLHSDLYATNLDMYVRYYLPISRNAVDLQNKGGPRDFGYGMLRLYVSPSKSWLDGKLTFNGTIIGNARFASLSPDERFARSTRQAAVDVTQGAATPTVPSSAREDMYLVLDPTLVYSVSSKVDLYLEWATGYLRHTTAGVETDSSGTHAVDGKWTSINHPTDGMYFSPGLYWNPTKKVYVNPYLSYQLSAVHETSPTSPKRRVSLFHCDVGVQLQYSFN